MTQSVTFTFTLSQLVGGVLLGGIILGVLLAIAFYKRSTIRDLINERL